jgi:outer membrane protein assembly factor BamB
MTRTLRLHRHTGIVVVGLLAILVPSATIAQADSPSPESATTLLWASDGDPDDPMGNTGDVTIAPDGRIWVADTGHSRFGILEPDGTFVEYWAAAKDTPGEFVLHRANGNGFANVAFAPDESFYVLDGGSRKVKHFASDRTFLGAWGGFGSTPGLFASPLWIAVDGDGTVLVVDDVRNVVERFAPDGTVLATFPAVPPEIGTADSIELDAAGDIYVSTCCPQATIRHYDRDGNLVWASPNLGVEGGHDDQATGMAVDDSGRVFAGGIPETTPNKIRVVGPDGSYLTRFGGTGEGPEDIFFPFALALDDQGALYATDYIDGSVKKYLLGPDLGPDAAAGDWPMFKGDAARRGEGVDGPDGAPVLRWRFQAQGAVPNQVSVGGKLAYASSDDGVLHALDVTTGAERWSYETDDPPLSGPVLDDGSVYVFDGVGILHAIDARTGAERWRATHAVSNPSNATVGAGAVYVGSEFGDLVAIDDAAGTELWRTAVSTTGGPVKTPAFAGGKVYVTAAGGGYVAVDATDGSVIWRHDTGDLETGTAVVTDGIAYAAGSKGGSEGTLWALDAESGTERWRVELPIGNPAIADGVAYAMSAELGVYALDAATGEQLWNFPVNGWTRPLGVADGVVYVPADSEHRVYAVDAATGDELWHYDVDSGIDCCIAVAKGAVYVGTFLGGVYAIGGTE